MKQTSQDTPLRRVRRARAMSQEHLALIVGVTQETISKAERGAPLSVDLQELVATVLGTPRSELFPESEVSA
jgi:transcriptional regulator with XRE-family HTH domain